MVRFLIYVLNCCAIYLAYLLFLHLNWQEDGKSKAYKRQIVLGVISSRGNFDNRNAIRKMWAKSIRMMKNVTSVFFIGEECSIPPNDRLDSWSCLPNSELSSRSEMNCSSILNRREDHMFQQSCYVGFGFNVLFPLTLVSVGVDSQLLKKSEQLFIVFRDANETFESVAVVPEKCVFKSNFCFIQFPHPYHLPRRFEGEISLMGVQDAVVAERCIIMPNGVLRYTFGRTVEATEGFKINRCSHIYINYTVHDYEDFLVFKSNRSQRLKEWELRNSDTKQRLLSEMEEFKDIVLLEEVIDVYRNLPLKLLEMINWTQREHPNSLLMKVDDDTFINYRLFETLLTKLISENEGDILAMWSHFYYHRSVPLFGKWADPEFKGISYPPFPTGSGYILSGSLVSLLPAASPYLRTFQGEDISIGIWTEILKNKSETVQKKNVRCWIPSEKCGESLLVPNLTPSQIRNYTNTIRSNG